MNKKDKFLILAITSPFFHKDEAKKITLLLENGEADYIHIRKPGSSINEMRNLIKNISEEYHHVLKLHDHFDLAKEFKIGGVHLNSRNNFPPANIKSVSKSLHSLKELESAHFYDYVTISPVFNSISKKGYESRFHFSDLVNAIKDKPNIIALGGVTPERIPLLKDSGFYGAAMLGYFFPD